MTRVCCLIAWLALVRAETVTLQNGALSLGVETSSKGIALTSIRNKSTNVEHLSRPSQLFDVAANAMVVSSSAGMVVDNVSHSGESSLSVKAHAKDLPLGFAVEVSLTAGEPAAKVRVTMTNTGAAKLALRCVIPRISGIVTAGPASERMGTAPIEIGGVARLENTGTTSSIGPAREPPLGERYNTQTGLPDAMSSLDVASIYDAGGTGGVFFADVDGDLDNDVAPIQFNLSAAAVNGYWLTDLKAGQTVSAPRFAVGVHNSGDWHAAVQYYVEQHRPRWKFPKIPAWFRDQGAIYGYSGGGAGGIYLMYPSQDLKQRIGSFRELPKLLDEAQRFGTNVVYIWGYWEGDPDSARPSYLNKGDYIPRSDMGGVPAFVEGIKALHQRGGKLVVYVEPFIIRYSSQIAKEKGEQWGGKDAAGAFCTHYPTCYSMPAPFVPWQDYIVKVSERLVKDYGVDGIFLDSWAWRMNVPMQNQEGGVLYSAKQYAQGVLTMTDRVRAAVQAIAPEAIVMGETTSGPIARHWDGGLSADFAWMARINQEKIIGSPVRYGIPEVNYFSNGRTLNELNQIFAAGHSLALCDAQLPWVSYIRSLVKIRQQYKDALIYGAQAYQPATGNADVAAYFYQGSPNRLITAVNVSAQRFHTVDLALRPEEAGLAWHDLLTDESFQPSKGRLSLTVPPGGLRILVAR